MDRRGIWTNVLVDEENGDVRTLSELLERSLDRRWLSL